MNNVFAAVLANRRIVTKADDQMPVDVHLDDMKPRPWIATHNGIINLDTRELLPHTSRWFSLAQVSWDYDPFAPVPTKWLAYLDEVMEGDTDCIALLQEVMGVCLSRNEPWPYYVMPIGTGANGKGVYTAMIMRLIGRLLPRAPPRPDARVGGGHLVTAVRSRRAGGWDRRPLSGGCDGRVPSAGCRGRRVGVGTRPRPVA